MLRTAIAAILVAAATVAGAANTETRAELSQAKARTVLDQAVEANGAPRPCEQSRSSGCGSKDRRFRACR